MTKKPSGLIRLVILLTGTILLLVYPVLNGYAILYSDTATYIISGFGLDMPFDRPITYGLFIAATSFGGLTFLSTLVIQSLIMAWLILRITEVFAGRKSWLTMALLYFLVAVPGGLSWYTGQLMPDFLTSACILAALLILHPAVQGKSLIIPVILYLLASASHMSHLSFNLVILLLLFVLSRQGYFRYCGLVMPGRFGILAGGIAVSYLVMMVPFSKSSHVFLMGSLVENGILEVYLDENCATENYKLCKYKDSLPETAWEFIWKDESPFYEAGGWKNSKAEFKEIIRECFTTPRYLRLQLEKSLENTPRQLASFKMGDGNGPFAEGTSVCGRITKYTLFDGTLERRALQQTSGFWFLPFANRMLMICVILATAGLILLMIFRYKTLGAEVLFISIVLCSSVLINAWIAATFGGITGRLGGKMAWIPLFVLGLMLSCRGIIGKKSGI